jgi:Fe-S oxidoreductase
MAEKKYPSLAAYFDEVARQAVEMCTFCGECVDHCSSYPLSPLKDKDGRDVMQSVIDFLKDGTYTDDVYTRAFTCAQCGHCSSLCPQELDPFVIMEATIMKLVESGRKVPDAVNFVIPEQVPNLVGVLASLQTKPSEERWLKKAPENPKPVENVVFLGCEPRMMPHKIFASLDVFDAMGLDYVTLAGGELCCGTPHLLAAGNPALSEKKARELMENIKAFSPKRVILVCPGCYRQFTEFFTKFMDVDVEVKFFTDLLNENMDKVKFTKPLNKTILLHNSCMAQRTKLADSQAKALESIPGLKLVGKDLGQEKFVCCGGMANMTAPDIGHQLGQAMVDEMMKYGADNTTDTCPNCMFASYMYSNKYPLNVRDIAVLLNEAMGGKVYEDTLEGLWKCKSLDELMDKTRENFQANGFPEEMMRQICSHIFPFAQPPKE